METVRENGELSILVISEDIPRRRAIRSGLESLGVGTVREVTNGISALRSLSDTGQVDGVFCDASMTPMDGIQFVRMLRRGQLPPSLHGHPSLPTDVPVVIVLSDARRDLVEKALRNGADGILAEPISTPQIEHCLQRCRRRQQISSTVGLSYIREVRPRYVRYALAGQFVRSARETIRRLVSDIETDQIPDGVVDLTDINFIDEFGIGSILLINSVFLDHRRRMSLVTGESDTLSVIKRAGISTVIPIYNNVISYTDRGRQADNL